LTNDRWLLLAVIGFGPLYAFSVYSFSESLTFVLTAALVLSISQGRNFFIPMILVFILSSSRETAFLSILPIAVSVLLISEYKFSSLFKKAAWIVFSSLSGLVTVFLFNIWKYGSWSNDVYADPIRRVPGVLLKLKNFLAIWISPSGGVLPFWFIGGLLALVIPVVAISHYRREIRKVVSALLLLATLLSQTVLLAIWFAPFGWVTWGPRLILPTVATVVFTSFILFPEVVQHNIEFMRSRIGLLILVFVLTFGSGVSNLGFILDRDATLSWFTPPLLPSCLETANIEINPDYYWSCALDFAPWQLGRTLWDSGLHQVTQGWAMIYLVLMLLVTVNIFSKRYSTLSATITSPPAIEENLDNDLSSERMTTGSSGKGTPLD
jgi:hypothetical protein